jgi:hypothetical protein
MEWAEAIDTSAQAEYEFAGRTVRGATGRRRGLNKSDILLLCCIDHPMRSRASLCTMEGQQTGAKKSTVDSSGNFSLTRPD